MLVSCGLRWLFHPRNPHARVIFYFRVQPTYSKESTIHTFSQMEAPGARGLPRGSDSQVNVKHRRIPSPALVVASRSISGNI
mmetsp:Transcript_771/g.2178  ORF Transcript_771/g.2178 Transcript_771/m.2178 type:complete len:82 (-) Transcript_771:55-300(-)